MHTQPDLLRHAVEYGQLLAHGIREATQNAEIERQVGDIEPRRQRLRIVLQRCLLVTTEHQSALIRSRVDVDIDDTGDWLHRIDALDGFGDQQLMPCRHDLDVRSGQSRHGAKPGARRIHHCLAAYRSVLRSPPH